MAEAAPTLTRYNRSWWTGKSGFIEAWHLTANDEKTKAGCWARLTLVAPKDRTRPPFANLWFAYFPPDGAATALVGDDIAAADCSFDQDAIRMGKGGLSHGRTWGEIAQGSTRMSWDLTFPPGREFLHMPKAVYALKLWRSFHASPHLVTRASGTVVINGKEIAFCGPATQGHLWGKQLPHRWVWLHAGAFSGREAVLEFISAQERVAGFKTPVFLTLFFALGGEEHHLFLTDRLLFEEAIEFPGYRFTAMNHAIKLLGLVSATLPRFVQYRYTQAVPGDVFCANTEIASLELTVFRRDGLLKPWRRHAVLTADQTAHFEVGSPEPIAALPVVR